MSAPRRLTHAILTEYRAAESAYEATFPDDKADWMLPEIDGTVELGDMMLAAVKRGAPLRVAELESQLDPLSWNI